MSLRFYPRGELGKQGGYNPGSDTNPAEDEEDAVAKGLRSDSGWRGFITPARAAKKNDFAKRTQRARQGHESTFDRTLGQARTCSADAAGSTGLAQTRSAPFGVLKNEWKGKRGRWLKPS